MSPAYAVRRFIQEVSVTANSIRGEKRIYTSAQVGGWGRNWYFMAGEGTENRRIAGHLTPLPRKRDEFHCKMASGKIGRFVVTKTDYCIDPPDMFFVDVKFGGYVE